MAMSVPWMDCTPPMHTTAPARPTNSDVSLGDQFLHVAEQAHPTTPGPMLSVSPGAQLDQHGGSPMSTTSPLKATPPKTTPPKPKYGEIHFVDMTNKKEAQRIRNTINSRKHRQNKLNRIRELEKKLAASEAEKQQLQAKQKD